MNQNSLLQQYFGFHSFRTGQEEAVGHILSGCDTLVIMPTGAGKSLIYQYAALVLRQRAKDRAAVTLVISPLIALMKDQVDSLQALGISATYINSTVSPAEQRQRSAAMLEGGYRLVYVAPERLRRSSFVEALKSVDIQLLVIDEAHCISSWGHDFRPDYRRIAGARKELGSPLTVALTATATTLVQDDIVQLLDMPEVKRVVTGFNRPNLSFEVLYASGAHAKQQELILLLQEQFGTKRDNTGVEACIIYAATRKEAEEVSSFVGRNLSIPCAYYHAGMAVEQRERIQNAFSTGSLAIVVATNAFGMGIDRQDVRLVVHYNLPGTLEAYYQEAGRAGRDGRPSRAVLLFSPQDRSLQNFFIRQNSITSGQLYQLFQRLESLPVEGSENSESSAGGRGRLCRVPELGRSMGWEPQKLRLALAHLEKAGILENAEFALFGGEEGALHLVLGDWHEESAKAGIRQVEEYNSHRKSQLEQMSHYAQADSCRRAILLSYFSDYSKAVELSADRCCDYCFRQGLREGLRRKGPAAGAEPEANLISRLSRSERAALIVLDSVRQLAENGIRVGRQRIAQMLSGSNSQKMTAGFRAQRYYGRLGVLTGKQIEGAINGLLQSGYLQHRNPENTDATIIALTRQGSEALELREAISLKAFDGVDGLPTQTTQASRGLPAGQTASAGKGSTTAETLRLLESGLSPEEVARERDLNVRTISSHIGSLIEQGRLDPDDYVSPEVRERVEKCLRQMKENGSDLSRLKPIKDTLSPSISYDEIKFVLGAWRRENGA
ncbi:RecQ family ATP-dependent DNA helicase [Candidatus Haliotispira prima]|uniref:ATP-dependent DNA helicase RecQ n=1 Tax=Candidatus Haliotispira prima TaxID=3034016 RepID=A0ABY8MES4_9SPIO|nr:RecQ family ATP-dependent DNA helicase [Candidatus Haliotispira prima]